MRAAAIGVGLLLVACSGSSAVTGSSGGNSGTTGLTPSSGGLDGGSGSSSTSGSSGGAGTSGSSTGSSGTVDAGPADAGPPTWQAGFHQAIRYPFSSYLGSVDTQMETYGLRIPVGRSGLRVRVTLKSGIDDADGGAGIVVKRAFIGKMDGTSLPAQMLALPIPDGGATVLPHALFTTGEAPLAVSAGDELLVTFEASGDIATSKWDVNEFPGGKLRAGQLADNPAALFATGGDSDYGRMFGVAEIDLFGPPSRAAIAIGDSITEGYITGTDDQRNTWTSVAQRQLGWPVVNSGVSGQGVWEESVHMDLEVLPAVGITDCLVMLGTNDLSGLSVQEIESRLQAMYAKLAPFCAVRAMTLPPKSTCDCNLTQLEADRATLNAWIRSKPANVTSVIDAEAALAAPGDPNHYAPGLSNDGIHPSIAGHQALGKAVADGLAH